MAIRKPKYMRRVFSGKDVPVSGLDQGKSPLYRGDGLQLIFNLTFETTLELRDGSDQHAIYLGGINGADKFSLAKYIASGNELYAEKI